jgi:6-pyruvoyltetrahydropterin/6-carboxytetrahydropterin synthase
MLHALSPKTFLKNFQVSAKNQRMKPDNKIETERLMNVMEIPIRKIMSRKKWVIEKRMEIAGCHKLTLGHVSPCSRLHGHNWIVGVKVEGRELNEDGMILDFSFISEVVKRLDHHYLNDVLGDWKNPTAENIAQWIAEEVQKLIYTLYPASATEYFPEEDLSPRVVEVFIQESQGNTCTFFTE